MIRKWDRQSLDAEEQGFGNDSASDDVERGKPTLTHQPPQMKRETEAMEIGKIGFRSSEIYSRLLSNVVLLLLGLCWLVLVCFAGFCVRHLIYAFLLAKM